MADGLRIVCDENLSITPALSAVARDIIRLPGRAISASVLRGVDVVLVRSVTRVDEALIAHSGLRFVGTATAGTEHIDIHALTRHRIPFASAPGANANAVVEYVLTALAFSGRLESLLRGGTIGVVGLGHVGVLLCRCVQALGGQALAYDPLLSQWPVDIARGSLSEVLAQPIVSLHAALHDNEPHASRNLVKSAYLSSFSAGQLFINAGRGGLIDRATLVALHEKGVSLVLDAWPAEPAIDGALLSMTMLATPHIAGYSLEAKAGATDMLVQAMAVAGIIDLEAIDTNLHAATPAASLVVATSSDLSGLLLAAYDIAADDRRLRLAATQCSTTDLEADRDVLGSANSFVVHGADFDALRRDYPLRQELRGRRLRLGSCSKPINVWADALGFTLN